MRMKYRMRVSVPATFAFLFAFGVANVCAPSAAAAKVYNVGIYYDVTPSWPDPPCPIHIRFHAEVGANLPPGKSREIVYHWETGKGRVYANHTLTIPPDETFSEPTLPPNAPALADTPTPIPRGRFQSSNGLDFHQTHPFRDYVVFVITSPVHEVTKSDNLDILCH